MSGIQLQISLDKIRNNFRSAIGAGEFIYLNECHIPENAKDINSAADRLKPLAEKMWSFDDMHGGLALTDLPDAPFSAAEIATALPEEMRNRNLFFLSGARRDEDAVLRELKIAAGAGAANICCVTGDAGTGNLRECRARNFTGSNRILTMASDAGCFFPGATVNPFHYRADTIFSILGNLRNKLASGAGFTVVQSGWDMLQNQTLSWYLLRNRIYEPCLVRLCILTPDKVEKIIAGEYPGLRISRDFRKLLEQELCGSSAQFEAAQYRRLELQAAGARLMGASGVIVSGADYPGKAETIARRLRSALEEFKSFDHWLDEYNRHQAGAEMHMSLHRFRLFDRVLRRDYPFDEPPCTNDPGNLPVSGMEKFGQRLRKLLFSGADKRRASCDRLLKKLLVSCKGCSHCRLPQHEFVCVENCPKKLEHGPCGGVREDGKCEVGDFECIHVKIIRFSMAGKHHSYLES